MNKAIETTVQVEENRPLLENFRGMRGQIVKRGAELLDPNEANDELVTADRSMQVFARGVVAGDGNFVFAHEGTKSEGVLACEAAYSILKREPEEVRGVYKSEVGSAADALEKFIAETKVKIDGTAPYMGDVDLGHAGWSDFPIDDSLKPVLQLATEVTKQMRSDGMKPDTEKSILSKVKKKAIAAATTVYVQAATEKACAKYGINQFSDSKSFESHLSMARQFVWGAFRGQGQLDAYIPILAGKAVNIAMRPVSPRT